MAGRIDYISNPKRQEYLYETYQTEGATPEFWKNLARENQLDFKASGSAGKCIEGREFIIALPESFVQYRAGDVVRLFTETFHKRYGIQKKLKPKSTAFIVATLLGLDTSDYSFEYIAGWNGKDNLKALSAAMKQVQDTANQMYDNIIQQLDCVA